MSEVVIKDANAIAQDLTSLEEKLNSAGDYSSKVIGEVFGNGWNEFGSTLDLSSHGSVFFEMLASFNIVVLAAVSFIVVYTAVLGIIGTGNDGKAFGKNLSMFWTPVRMAIAITMLLPAPMLKGLSIIQGIVLLAVFQSITLANGTYNISLQYLAGFNPESHGAVAPNGAGTQHDKIKVSDQMFISDTELQALSGSLYEAPMSALSGHHFMNNLFKDPETAEALKDIADIQSSPDYVLKSLDGTEVEYVFSGYQNTPLSSTYFGLVALAYNEFIGNDVNFGKVTYNCALPSESLDSENMSQAHCAIFQQKYNAFIASMNNEAKKIGSHYYQQLKLSEGERKPYQVDQGVSASLKSQFREMLITLQKHKLDTAVKLNPDLLKSNKVFLEAASQGGWFTAGTYYWTYSKLMDKVNKNIELKADLSGVYNPAEDSNLNEDELDIRIVKGLISSMASGKTFAESNTGTMMSMINQSNDMVDEVNDNGWYFKMIGDLLMWPSAGIFIDQDPIMGLKSYGKSMLAGSVLVGIGASYLIHKGKSLKEGFLNKVVGKIPGIGTAVGGASGFMGSALLIMGYIVLGLMLTMLVAAVVFAFYIPMIPTVLWIAGVLNWLLFVVEAMLASAIWAATHAAPEGEGFTGQHAKQGYMLLLQVLLRPTLLVIGLFAGIAILQALGYIVAGLLLPAMRFEMSSGEGFWGVLTDILLSVFSFAIFLVVLFVIMVMYIHRVFDATFTFADNVMKWAGNSAASLNEKGDMNEAKQSFVGFANKGGSTVSQGFSNQMRDDQAAKRAAQLNESIQNTEAGNREGLNQNETQNLPSESGGRNGPDDPDGGPGGGSGSIPGGKSSSEGSSGTTERSSSGEQGNLPPVR